MSIMGGYSLLSFVFYFCPTEGVKIQPLMLHIRKEMQNIFFGFHPDSDESVL